MPAVELQPGITALALGVCRGDTLALAIDQMLLSYSKQSLAFGQAYS